MRLMIKLALFTLLLTIGLAACTSLYTPEPTHTKINSVTVEAAKNSVSTNTPAETSPEELQIQLSPGPQISIKNAHTLELITKREGHTDRLLSLAMDNDGRLISGGNDNRILIWPAGFDEEPVLLTTMPRGVCDLQVSSANLLLAYAFNHQANLWDLNTLDLVTEDNLAGTGYDGIFSPDGSVFGIEGSGDTIIFKDTDSLETIKTFHEPNGGGFAYSFSPDGTLFTSSAHNGTVTIWDFESGEVVNSLKYRDGDMHAMAFSADGSLIAAGSTDSVVVIWDVQTGEYLHTLRHNDGLYGIDFSPDGSLLASAAADRTVKVWNVETGENLKTLRHGDEVNAVIFSLDGAIIYSGGYDNVIYVWSVVEDL